MSDCECEFAKAILWNFYKIKHALHIV